MHGEYPYDLAAQIGARDLHEGCMMGYQTKERRGDGGEDSG